MTSSEEMVTRLKAACNGHPTASIAWPHRLLHEAADLIAKLNHECQHSMTTIAAERERADTAEAALAKAVGDERQRILVAMYGLPLGFQKAVQLIDAMDDIIRALTPAKEPRNAG